MTSLVRGTRQGLQPAVCREVAPQSCPEGVVGVMVPQFAYTGPAVIGGVPFDRVQLAESPPGEGGPAWAGATTFRQEEAPVGFTPRMAVDSPMVIGLPDGRTGEALVVNIHFNGQGWTMELIGSGPVPQ